MRRPVHLFVSFHPASASASHPLSLLPRMCVMLCLFLR
uniref:Uncharacterized protein n=1 Tax=Arundo donax TaxID=35708 RepID=A0A0A8YD94_ARUDO